MKAQYYLGKRTSASPRRYRNTYSNSFARFFVNFFYSTDFSSDESENLQVCCLQKVKDELFDNRELENEATLEVTKKIRHHFIEYAVNTRKSNGKQLSLETMINCGASRPAEL